MCKKILAILLSFLMVVSFAACNEKNDDHSSNKPTTDTTKETGILKLPYSREDGLNPFKAKSLLNRGIMPLIYSGLYRVDKNYNAIPDLASSAEFVGNTAIIKLNPAKTFTNGTKITADDVVYSYEHAITSTYYASSLASVAGVAAADPLTVVVTTNFANQYILSSLTFPIVAINSAEGSTAIGVGQYSYSDTTSGGILSRDESYSDSAYNMDKIELVNITDENTLMFSLVLGNFNAIESDMSSGKSQRINASSVQTDLNNIVFLGINYAGVLGNPELRKCLSAVINRTELLSAGLEGYGVETNLPFNPNWYAATNVKKSEMDLKTAKEKLSSSLNGYSIVILNNSNNEFKVKLAETLKSQLESLGVSVTISSVPYETYLEGITGGYYDIYIGEMKLTNDMNIASLLSGDLLTNYAEMMAGNLSAQTFVDAFSAETPFIPVCFRNGVLAYSRAIETEVNPLPGNVYGNVTDWFI
ncbi:MAG: ABC transporter substrate-binding protein [Oscillospiraceae bacterium]|nr:ABC transporter substrate-binding protein [Oscillospiraceae bacterium]